MAAVSNSARAKVLATVLAVSGAVTVAGLGTFGSFTSTTSASTTLSSGTVQIALGTAGSSTNRLTIGASGLVPGDTVQRAVDLSVGGDQALASVALTTSASPSTALDTDPTNGLQMVVDACSVPWTETAVGAGYTYTCGGATSSVIASRPVIGSALTMSGLALTPASVNHLRVTLTFPTTADNTFQGLSSTIDFVFDGVQRNGSPH